MRKTFFLKLYPALVILILGPLLALAVVMTVSIRQFGITLSEYELGETTRITANMLGGAIDRQQNLDEAIKELARESRLRFTIIQNDGTVLFDSVADPATMENHLNREEVQLALKNGSAHAFRASATIKEESAYAAVRLDRPGRDGFPLVVRVALPMPQISDMLLTTALQIALASLVIVATAFLAAWIIARRLRRPVAKLEATAKRWANGEWAARASVREPWELAQLSGAMNNMANDLQHRVASLEQAREETLAILNAMTEAVIVTGPHGRVVALNPTAAKLFDTVTILPESEQHPSLLEVSHATELAGLEEEARAGRLAEATIEWFAAERRTLQVTAAPLPKQGGAVMVLNDITRLMRLETIRKDFVANVSHELKTPIQSIKGFVETLESGALDNPDDARRFMAIIRRNTERLEAIIADLLSLARLEGLAERGGLTKTPVDIDQVVHAALDTLADALKAKSITVETKAAGDQASHQVPGSEGLIEQVLLNLVENAIKYCPEESRIVISHGPSVDGSHYLLRVADNGPGIPPRDLERIFERFYRVEKSRHRDSGGTGLGLAIVRHIALLHGGTISAQSQIGQGCSFELSLPLA